MNCKRASIPAIFVSYYLARLLSRQVILRRAPFAVELGAFVFLVSEPAGELERFAKPYGPSRTADRDRRYPPSLEGAAKWLAIGLENRGDRKVRGSIPQSSANSPA